MICNEQRAGAQKTAEGRFPENFNRCLSLASVVLSPSPMVLTESLEKAISSCPKSD